jgi:hypothetical protein
MRLLVLLLLPACLFGGEDTPKLSSFHCMPDPLVHTQPPYTLQCHVQVDEDCVSDLDVQVTDSAGTAVMTRGPTFMGLVVGPVDFTFDLLSEPAPGALKIRMTGLGISDGNGSNVVTTTLTVQ